MAADMSPAEVESMEKVRELLTVEEVKHRGSHLGLAWTDWAAAITECLHVDG